MNYSARGYYRNGSLVPGMPGPRYVPIPSSLTHSELARLQQDCVDRINMYRSGALGFTGGTSDPGVPKPALTHLEGNNTCSSAQALGTSR